MKTNKSLSKRLRVTRTGKILARYGGQNHFNAKQSRNKQMAGKRWRTLNLNRKLRARFLANQ